MKNTIAERIADFLKAFPPFDQLSKKDLLLISGEVTISYIEKDKAVYRSGDLLHDKFYIINKGAIALKKEIKSKLETVDRFDEGDILGLLAFRNYKTRHWTRWIYMQKPESSPTLSIKVKAILWMKLPKTMP